MRAQEPTTQTLEIADLDDRLGSLVDEVARNETRVLVAKAGVPVAAIISAEDLMRLDRLDRQRAERFAVIDRMREAFKDVPPEQIEHDVAEVIAEVRAEDEAELGADQQATVERRPA